MLPILHLDDQDTVRGAQAKGYRQVIQQVREACPLAQQPQAGCQEQAGGE